MKLLCESCERLAAPGSWSVDGGVLRLVCAGCGHVHELASPAAPPRPAPERRPPPAPAAGPVEGWLERGWADVRQRWGDPAAHQRLIDEAVARGGMAELGRLYREVIEASPGDAAALAGREALIARASAQLMTGLAVQERGFDPGGARRARGVLLAVTALGLLAFVAWAFVKSGVLQSLP